MMTFALLATTAFCKIATPTTLTYAPDYIAPLLRPPTEEDYLSRGWLKNAVTSPEEREGYYAILDHYEARGEAVYAVYRYDPIPPPVRVYSVARLVYFLTEKGVWDSVKTTLGDSLIVQACALGEFDDSNEDFQELKPAMIEAFGEELVSSALDYASSQDTSARLSSDD